MSMIARDPKVYKDGRTKQAFKDSCDINKILAKQAKTGTISHLAKHEAFYGDFAAFDFQEAMNRIAAGEQIFRELPSEIRREFHQSPQEFFQYVNDPANKDDLANKLPGLAQPGTQRLVVDTQAAAAAAASPPEVDVPNSPSEPDPTPVVESQPASEAS